MSSKTISYALKVDGVLTNATTVKLSDPTGTFGVRRQDTQEAIVAEGVDFTHDSTGLYSYALTNLVAGVVYEYWIKRVYAGVTNRTERTFAASPKLEGYYASLSDLYAIAGEMNVQTYSALDGGSTLDEDRVQAALDQTDTEINAYLIGAGVESPAQESETLFMLLTQSSARLAACWLYRSRGNRDVPADGSAESGEYYAKLGGWRKEAYGLMSRYILNKRQAISTAFTTT